MSNTLYSNETLVSENFSLFDYLSYNDIVLFENGIPHWEVTREHLIRYGHSIDEFLMYSICCSESGNGMTYAMNTGHTIRVYKCENSTCDKICLEFEGTSLSLNYVVDL